MWELKILNNPKKTMRISQAENTNLIRMVSGKKAQNKRYKRIQNSQEITR